jgi:hypothetical protein
MGAVEWVRIRRSKSDEASGIAYVQFETVDGARIAQQNLNGASIKGELITIDFFKPPDQRQNIRRRLPPNMVAVRAIDGNRLPSEASLADRFAAFGEICQVFTIGEYGIVCFRVEAKDAANYRDGQVESVSGVLQNVLENIFREVEARGVYVSDLVETDEAAVRDFLGTAGRIVSYQAQPRAPDSIIVQFETVEARNFALEKLDGGTFGNQIYPVRILPFFDKRVVRGPAGLLQLNEVKPTLSRAELRAIYAPFGSIVAVSIVPTAQPGTCIGYVLFDAHKSADAARVRGPFTNAFLYPEVDPTKNWDPALKWDIVASFRDRGKGRWLAIYGLPLSVREADIERRLRVAPYEALWQCADDTSRTVYVSYITRDGVTAAIRAVAADRWKYDVLSTLWSFRTGQALSALPLTPALQDRFVFVCGIENTTSPRGLRQRFEAVGRVESAIVLYHPDSGLGIGKGCVLFATAREAKAALSQALFDGESLLTVCEFLEKSDRQAGSGDLSHPPSPPLQPAASGYAVIPRARERLKELVRRNASGDALQGLLQQIDGSLCLDDVYDVLQNEHRFREWLLRY